MLASYQQLNDEELAVLTQNKDSQAYEELVKRYEAKMFRYGRKFLRNQVDIEDLVQDTFLKAYVNINSFDKDLKFSPWLYRIAHNTFINAIKKQEHQPFLFFDPDALFPHPIAKDKTDKEINDKQIKVTIDRCLAEIDAKYREPLILFYLEELSYQEIGDILQIPVSTVGVRIKRAKDKMASILKAKNYEY